MLHMAAGKKEKTGCRFGLEMRVEVVRIREFREMKRQSRTAQGRDQMSKASMDV